MTENEDVEIETLGLSELALKLKASSVVIAGNRGTGKTNLAKHLAREFLGFENVTVQIYDSSLAWFNDFDKIPFQFCSDYIPFDCPNPSENPNMLFSIEFEDSEDINFIVRECIRENYLYRRTKTIANGMTQKFAKFLGDKPNNFEPNPCHYIAFIEEAQNTIGTYALMSRDGRKWLKILSDCRNLNMSIFLIGQRLSDISAKAIERCNCYFFGRLTGDNDLIKVRRILGSDNKHIVEKIKRLEIGEFIFYDGKTVYFVKLPKFTTKETPILVNEQKAWFKLRLDSEQPQNMRSEISYWIKNLNRGLKK